MKRIQAFLVALASAVLLVPAAPTGQQARFNESLFQRLAWRNLGPFRTGAWTTAIAVPDAPLAAHLYTFYVGTRNGGVWKTVNNGTTFEPVFDGQPSLSIGAIDVAPSDQNVVWVGTGEAYQARSSYSGDGVYKSTDAGKTWTNMGLRDSHHISRIVIHPRNPNTVYVAAMGHLFTANSERGVFMTEDGGKTWKKSLFVDEKTGVIDLVMSRKNPRVLYAATYELTRKPWDLDIGGPGSGIWKTTDGGRTWKRLGGGLPSGRLGRIGIDLYQANPDILYAVIENANLRKPTDAEAKRDADRPEAERVRRRQRSVPNERQRTDVEEDARGHHQHRQQGGLLLQHHPGRSRRREPRRGHLGRHAQLERRRQDVAGHVVAAERHVREGVRRLPRVLVGPAEPGPDPRRQRRRVLRLVRPRQDRRPLHEHPGRRVLRRRRRHGGPVQRVRRHAGPRLVEGPQQQLVRRGERRRLDHRRHRRRHVQPRGSDRSAVALQHVAIRRSQARRPGAAHDDRHHAAPPEGPAAAALELEHAARPVAPQPADPLHRRPGAPALAQPRRRLAGDQPGPRRQTMPARRSGAGTSSSAR